MALKDFIKTTGPDRDANTERVVPSVRPPVPAPRTVAPATSIDATTTLTGKIRCQETIRIDGQVKGEICCEKLVIVGAGAIVEASIQADSAQIAGEVRGDIVARRKVTLEKTAVVIGNLSTAGIVIEEGAKLEGRIVIGEDEKSAAKATKAAKPEAKDRPAAPQAAAPTSSAGGAPPAG